MFKEKCIKLFALVLVAVLVFPACGRCELTSGDITLRVAFRGNYDRDAIRAGLEPWIQETGIGVDLAAVQI